MLKEYSPFTPGIPVPIEFFTGRTAELEHILGSVNRCIARKNIERIFVLGERGIGKSSLCSMARIIAENQKEVLGVHVYLGGTSTLEEMARKIFDQLLKDSIGKTWFSKIKNFLGSHVREVGAFGVSLEFNPSPEELAHAVSSFIPALCNLYNEIQSDRKGILIILDDLNGLAGNEQFAQWLKSIIDELATSSNLPITIILVGLPERRLQLLKGQPSLDRVFDPVNIDKFNRIESDEFFVRSFQKIDVRVEQEALQLMYSFAEGYPAFMHEIGDAVHSVDDDNIISEWDAWMGVYRAADRIGGKYIEPTVMEALRSETYKSILERISSEEVSYPFLRKDISRILHPRELKVFDNFLNRMVELGAMKKRAGGSLGRYEFTRELYRLYLRIRYRKGLSHLTVRPREV